MGGLRTRARAIGIIIVFAVGSLSLAGQPVDGGFTTEQAAQGRAAYVASCASCHQPDLRGAFEANPLVGPTFMNKWASRPVSELIHYVQGAMPPDRPGSLGAQAYVSLVAYILQSNGGVPGSEPLGSRSAFALGAVATGGSPAAVPSVPAAASAPAPAGGAAPGNESPRGLTVSGPRERLDAGDRRDAASSGPARLADGARRLCGFELYCAGTHYTRQRREPATRVGLADERGGVSGAVANRARWHDVSGEHRRHYSGTRPEDRRAPLGASRRSRVLCEPEYRDLRRSPLYCDWRRPTRGARRTHGDARMERAHCGTGQGL